MPRRARRLAVPRIVHTGLLLVQWGGLLAGQNAYPMFTSRWVRHWRRPRPPAPSTMPRRARRLAVPRIVHTGLLLVQWGGLLAGQNAYPMFTSRWVRHWRRPRPPAPSTMPRRARRLAVPRIVHTGLLLVQWGGLLAGQNAYPMFTSRMVGMILSPSPWPI